VWNGHGAALGWSRPSGGNPQVAPAADRGHAVLTDKQEGPMADESYTGEAYCVKCKEKREFTGHVEETNGRRFAKGICPVCGTKVTRILGKA
jgi:hypothetical protein